MAAPYYYTHGNGGRPFRVVVAGGKASPIVQVYKRIGFDETRNDYEAEPCFSLHAKKVWVGNDLPKGNSILLLDGTGDRYVFIGTHIFSFKARAPITRFESPIGNSDVPYPYAVDSARNIYLLIEGVVMCNVPKNVDPYNYYYDKGLISPDISFMGADDNSRNWRVKDFTIGDEQYTLTYNPHPGKDYDRMAKWPDFGKGLVVHFPNRQGGVALNREEYIKLMRAHGRRNGLSALRRREIVTPPS